MHIAFRELVFLVVARQGSVLRAADVLHLELRPSKTSTMSASFPMSIGRPKRQEATQNNGL